MDPGEDFLLIAGQHEPHEPGQNDDDGHNYNVLVDDDDSRFSTDDEAAASEIVNGDDEENIQVFGSRVNISQWPQYGIKLGLENANGFSLMQWERLGRCIAISHYRYVLLGGTGLDDAKMSALFKGLTKGVKIAKLDLSDGALVLSDNFGVDGIRSMVPFLQNASNSLAHLVFDRNRQFDSECFEVLISALHGRSSISQLNFGSCNVTDISALENYTVSNLQSVFLHGNKIGRDGCMTLARLVQREDTAFTFLDLTSTGMGDAEAEILALSLKHNKTLRSLKFGGGNAITERGCRAFLKLLNDISSIDSTLNSNHTLTTLVLPHSNDATFKDVVHWINWAMDKGKGKCLTHGGTLPSAATYTWRMPSPEVVGRIKVRKTQLRSARRRIMCQLQKVEFSHTNILEDIDTIILPEAFALIWKKNGKSDLYRVLLKAATDLLSLVNKPTALKEQIIDEKAELRHHDIKSRREAAALRATYEEEAAALRARYEEESACLAAENFAQTKALHTKISELSNELTLAGKKRHRTDRV